jgi:hypothetical protein
MNTCLTACSAALLSLSLVAGDALAYSDDEIEAQCREYASEDAVPPEEMDDYLAECIQSLRDSGDESTSSDAPEYEE